MLYRVNEHEIFDRILYWHRKDAGEGSYIELRK